MEPMVTKLKNRAYQDFASRLQKACDETRLPKTRGRATALGKMMKVSYKAAGKWLEGYGMPDMGHATILATKLDVNFEWLMTGRGSMEFSERFLQAAETPALQRVSRNELEIIAQHMPRVVRELVMTYIETLQLMLEKQPELFTDSKSERSIYKKWKEDYRQIKNRELMEITK